ncbi:Uncharacterised protein [Vibrio cholerae]|nr:Uncharacterised protein [Vibrio cholerae]
MVRPCICVPDLSLSSHYWISRVIRSAKSSISVKAIAVIKSRNSICYQGRSLYWRCTKMVWCHSGLMCCAMVSVI